MQSASGRRIHPVPCTTLIISFCKQQTAAPVRHYIVTPNLNPAHYTSNWSSQFVPPQNYPRPPRRLQKFSKPLTNPIYLEPIMTRSPSIFLDSRLGTEGSYGVGEGGQSAAPTSPPVAVLLDLWFLIYIFVK